MTYSRRKELISTNSESGLGRIANSAKIRSVSLWRPMLNGSFSSSSSDEFALSATYFSTRHVAHAFLGLFRVAVQSDRLTRALNAFLLCRRNESLLSFSCSASSSSFSFRFGLCCPLTCRSHSCCAPAHFLSVALCNSVCRWKIAKQCVSLHHINIIELANRHALVRCPPPSSPLPPTRCFVALFSYLSFDSEHQTVGRRPHTHTHTQQVLDPTIDTSNKSNKAAQPRPA